MRAEELKEKYEMGGHEENGLYLEQHYRHEGPERAASGSSYFYVHPDEITLFHRIDCDEYWVYNAGENLEVWIIDACGKLTVRLFGGEGEADPLIYLPKGVVFASRHPEDAISREGKRDGTFFTCITVPRFDYRGFELLERETVVAMCPEADDFWKTRQIQPAGPIVVQGAMDNEIEVLLSMMQVKEKREINKIPFYIGNLEGKQLIVMKTFMGEVNCAAATMTLLTHFQPSCVINQGICGGHDPIIRTGDFLIGEKLINDSSFCVGIRETEMQNNCVLRPLGTEPLTGFEPKDGKWSSNLNFVYRSDPDLCAKAKQAYENYLRDKQTDGCTGEDLPLLYSGVMASSDLWIDRLDLMNTLRESYQTRGEEMEGVAAAQLCASFGVPFLSIRTLSNSLPRGEELKEETCYELQRMLPYLIRLL